MRIVNFGQVVDLEHGGGFAHQFTVELPSGERISIITDEDTVQQLLEVVSMAKGEAPRRVSPSNGDLARQVQEAARLRVVEEPPDIDPGELSMSDPMEVRPAMGKVADVPMRAPTGISPGGLGQKPSPVKRKPLIDEDGFMIAPPPRTVPTDEMGYPITANSRAEPDPEPEEEDYGEQI